MNGPLPNKNYLGRLAIVLHAHLPYVRKNEKNSLEEDWLFQAILECYIPLLQVMESSRKQDTSNTKLTLSLSPTLLSLCLLYTSPSPRDGLLSRMPSSA